MSKNTPLLKSAKSNNRQVNPLQIGGISLDNPVECVVENNIFIPATKAAKWFCIERRT